MEFKADNSSNSPDGVINIDRILNPIYIPNSRRSTAQMLHLQQTSAHWHNKNTKYQAVVKSARIWIYFLLRLKGVDARIRYKGLSVVLTKILLTRPSLHFPIKFAKVVSNIFLDSERNVTSNIHF